MLPFREANGGHFWMFQRNNSHSKLHFLCSFSIIISMWFHDQIICFFWFKIYENVWGLLIRAVHLNNKENASFSVLKASIISQIEEFDQSTLRGFICCMDIRVFILIRKKSLVHKLDAKLYFWSAYISLCNTLKLWSVIAFI